MRAMRVCRVCGVCRVCAARVVQDGVLPGASKGEELEAGGVELVGIESRVVQNRLRHQARQRRAQAVARDRDLADRLVCNKKRK